MHAGPRVKSTAQLTPGTETKLRAWAVRHELSVTAAVQLALERYLPCAREPLVRRPGPRVRVVFRLPFALHQQTRAEAGAWACGYSRMVEAAVVALVAGEGLFGA